MIYIFFDEQQYLYPGFYICNTWGLNDKSISESEATAIYSGKSTSATQVPRRRSDMLMITLQDMVHAVGKLTTQIKNFMEKVKPTV